MSDDAVLPVLDPAAIRQLLDITGGDAEFLDELLQAFVDGASAQLADMEAALAAGSMEDLVRPAHSLKSNSANIGATRLVEIARGLEADARTGVVRDAAVRVASATTEFELVRVELERIRGRR